MKRLGCALAMLIVVGCTAPQRREPPPVQGTQSVEQLAAAVAADAKRSDTESDPKVRTELAASATRDADACLAREPQAAACFYAHAVALGLEARSHPTRAGELLKTMLGSLDNADAVNPNIDEAGPSRVRALVLIRAPGWPLGPGDTEAGLVAARRAVALRPQYPPNQLALAEALKKNGDASGARQSYQQAFELAQALPASPDRDGWLRDANEALRH